MRSLYSSTPFRLNGRFFLLKRWPHQTSTQNRTPHDNHPYPSLDAASPTYALGVLTLSPNHKLEVERVSPEFRIVAGMALMRLISASIEITAALFMLRLAKIEVALRINATLGLVGPMVMIGVTTLGLVGLAGQLSYGKLFFIVLGVGLILYGVRN